MAAAALPKQPDLVWTYTPEKTAFAATPIIVDGIVYVGDRVNNRIQAFRLDGTYINEVFIERQTKARFGTGFGAAFSPDAEQRYFYVPDGTNKKVQIVDRRSMTLVGYFGGYGGKGVGEFSHIHSIATDSHGNVYLGEVDTGRRVYRWNPAR